MNEDIRDPVWVTLATVFFREESLSRRGAAYRLVLLAAILLTLAAVLVAEYH